MSSLYKFQYPCILKCFVTDQDTDQTIQLSFPRKWLSIDNLSLVNVLKKILNILTDYIHSQYDDDHIQQIFQQSFQDSHNINLNLPTDPDFINKIHQDIIIVDQQLIEKHRPYCGICQESLKINESVINLALVSEPGFLQVSCFLIEDQAICCFIH